MKFILPLMFLLAGTVYGQSTWNDIHAIFQTKCAIACHNGGNPSGNLILDGTTGQVYSNIVGVQPTNPAALAKGNYLIAAGYPERSFLLRKCNNGWDSYYSLDVAEGAAMPQGQPALTHPELEKIRQWILFGAPQTGVVVADSTIQDFYNGFGMAGLPAPAAPAAGQGFQIKLGPFFLEPGTEVEYFKKHALQLNDSIEVNKVEIVMNTQSHHYIIYKFHPGAGGGFPEGLRGPNTAPSGNSASLSAAAQFSKTFDLPAQTAFYWEKNTILDLNYHILNYSQDSILGAEVFANIYTQPKGTAETQMYSALVPYSQIGNPSIFNIPANGVTKTFTDPFFLNNSADMINVWLLSSHTHKWGIDYDIYLRNPNGTKGMQVYEGFYNTDYTFNQGYYDWAHPAIREFDPLLDVNLKDGLIQEAQFRNLGNSTAYFGLTTADEMMLFTIMYTVNWEGPTAIGEQPGADAVRAFPNPSNGEVYLKMDQPYWSGVLYDVTGREVRRFNDQASSQPLPTAAFPGHGIYFLQVKTTDGYSTIKISRQ